MPVYLDESQDKLQFVTEHILPYWEEYCIRNWLSSQEGDVYSAEQRVKTFLDSCAYLLLRDNPEDTLTLYKQYATGSSEIPVSSCPAYVEGKIYGTSIEATDSIYKRNHNEHYDSLVELEPKRAKKVSRRSDVKKAEQNHLGLLRNQYPGASFEFCLVDTEGRFLYNGYEYCISGDLKQYMGKNTNCGTLYDMDKIVAMRHSGHVLFFDQKLCEIDEASVKKL